MNSKPDGTLRGTTFWTVVWREARATWGRRLWLWAALALSATPAAWYGAGWNGDWPVQLVSQLGLPWWALGCWVPAWLCSDLLSLKFPRNPDPLREWHPSEFAARALGRLLPFYLAFVPAVAALPRHPLTHTPTHPIPGG